MVKQDLISSSNSATRELHTDMRIVTRLYRVAFQLVPQYYNTNFDSFISIN